MTLDSFIEELEQRMLRCDGDEPMSVHHEVEDRDAWLGNNAGHILAMAKALQAADNITCFSCVQSYGERGHSDCVDDEYCAPYRRLRAEVDL